jgi:uncharacterized protein YgbK (DUF1537 family)
MIRLPELAIMADDLTGACDAAAAFAPSAGPVEVFIRPPRASAMKGHEKVLAVINTQSRLLPPRKSRNTVMRLAHQLGNRPVLFMKTDSVLRGSAGAELEGLTRALPSRSLFLIPAVPEMGKTTRGGRLFEHGIPAHQTEYGKDPVSPLYTNDIRAIIGRTGSVNCQVVDAETSEDIDRAVQGALRQPSVILAGSVGLADALARRVESTAGMAGIGMSPERTLIVSGSGYPRALEQLQFAADACGEKILEVGRNTRVTAALANRAGKVAFLRIETGAFRTRCEGRWALSVLFRKVREFIRLYDPHALGIVGGETAYRIFRLLRATRLKVLGREQQGMPYGMIEDGALAGRAFATKGGSVGSRDACARMVACMKLR